MSDRSAVKQPKPPANPAFSFLPGEPRTPAAIAERVFHQTMEKVSTDLPRAAFFARMLEVMEHLVTEISDASLGASLAAPSGLESLVSALASPENSLLASGDISLMIRGIDARRRLLEAEGGTVPTEEVEKLLDLSRQQVNNRRKAKRLLAVALGRRGFRYPLWQFDLSRGMTLEGFEATLAELVENDPWGQLMFFLEPNDRLESTGAGDAISPLEALRAGRVMEVVQAARAWQQHGAA